MNHQLKTRTKSFSSLLILNKYLSSQWLWATVSAIVIVMYLSPLLINGGIFYTPIFDNLDSTVIWSKILAESGKIFAASDAIIPNMMNGLPRASYFNEFNLLVWLYYFFQPLTAFIINEITIHLTAFFSMYVFLNRYVVKPKKYYKNIPVFIGSLYFALLPYWSGAIFSIALLPLVTYSLLNIKNGRASKRDWLLILILPFFGSFLFIYMFYIVLAGIYLFWNAAKERRFNTRFFLALFLMGCTFLLAEYRLVLATFSDFGFISHRTEFDVFFTYDLLESYRRGLAFFLSGHTSHVPGLQFSFVLPVIIIGMFLTLSKRRFNSIESLAIWTAIVLSFAGDVWTLILIDKLTFLWILILSAYMLFNKSNRTVGLLMIFQIFMALTAASWHYEGLHWLGESIEFFRKVNFTRIAFVQPFIWGILLAMTMIVLHRKLRYSFIFISIFMGLQILTSFVHSNYQTEPRLKYSSFKDYYAPELFESVKKRIPEPIDQVRVVSYGLEPAVSLYNGFYTIDGYSPNYPLSYKHRFRNVISEWLDDNSSEANAKAREIYDQWGSKVYILSTTVTFMFYDNSIVVRNPIFNADALCALGSDYLLSAYMLEKPNEKKLLFIDKFIGDENSWTIHLYKFDCD